MIDTFLVRLLFPTGAIAFALLAQNQHWGAFNRLGWPFGTEVLLALLLLDLALYFQHRLFHGVPLLWRLHRMHHADVDVDVTTGNRFHPLEMLLSMGIKFLVIVTLGAPALAVLLFEVLLNATSLFNHSNFRVYRRLEPLLRWLVVTPDMHRVHHSVLSHETDSNYGFNFPLWDRLFGTYRPQPRDGHANMQLGLPEFRDTRESRLLRLLTQPFRTPEPTASSSEKRETPALSDPAAP